jgi:hypothetical protein
MFKLSLKKPFIIHDVSDSCSPLDSRQQLLIEKVIEILKTNPECFSARWFSGKSLDSSVQHKNKEILIVINTGQIIRPIEPKMSKKQKEEIKNMIKPIVKKDSDYLVERLVCNCH